MYRFGVSGLGFRGLRVKEMKGLGKCRVSGLGRWAGWGLKVSRAGRFALQHRRQRGEFRVEVHPKL